MNRSIFNLLLVFVLLFVNENIIFAQSLKNYAKQRKQEQTERRRMEDQNYQNACDAGTKSALNEYVALYPNGKYVQEAQNKIAEFERIEELDYYKKVCKQGTLSSFNDYLRKYPEGAHKTDIKNRIDDYELWNEAKKINSKSAYHNYINISRNKSFESQAREAIEELESVDEWSRIMNSTSSSDIARFINTYPNSSCFQAAVKRKHELDAVSLYQSKMLKEAYEEFLLAGGRMNLSVDNQRLFDRCEEYVEFNKLSSNSDETNLLTFLNKYPGGQYSDKVSNYLAIVKARKFTMFSSETSYNSALSYAKDNATRDVVNSYIVNSKKSYSRYKRLQRHNRIMENGGYVKVGLDVSDFSINGFAYRSDQRRMSFNWNIGISIKLGNYRAPVQFEIGVKPGVICMDYDLYVNDDAELDAKFHMPAFAKLKINLFGLGDSKCYMAGLGWYNFVRDKDEENEIAAGGGLGFAWKHWDWLTLYYRQDINGKEWLDDKFLGTSIIYYF